MGWGAEDFLDDFKRPRRGLRTVGILGLWDSRAKAPGANAQSVFREQRLTKQGRR